MKSVSRVCVVAVVLFASALGASGGAPTFRDPLDTPAARVRTPERNFIFSAARAGTRLVAVGPQGLIVVSQDNGRTWKQARVPVQTDLTAVHFPTDTVGWAVGHDGVVLQSKDGGLSWVHQTDGRATGPLAERYYSSKIAEGNVALAADLDEIKLNYKNITGQPFLSVWFESASTGYAVGAFGTIEATTDGGKTWLPWLDRVDNPQFYHLNMIRGIAGDVYVAGEHGMVYRLDKETNRFIGLPTGYEGSFFGITGDKSVIVAFGLRGTIYRSIDRGAHWTKVDDPIPATLLDGTVLDDGRICLVNGGGMVLVSVDQGHTFRPEAAHGPVLTTSVIQIDSKKLMLAGMSGIETIETK